MSSSTSRPEPFAHDVFFNLGQEIHACIYSGIQALVHHYGGRSSNYQQIIEVMRAFRGSVGRGGNLPYDTTMRQLHEHRAPIAQALFDGVEFVLNRFGNTAATRHAIAQMFHAIEDESVEQHNLHLHPFDWDKDDDPYGDTPKSVKFPPGTSWGDVSNASLPSHMYPGL